MAQGKAMPTIRIIAPRLLAAVDATLIESLGDRIGGDRRRAARGIGDLHRRHRHPPAHVGAARAASSSSCAVLIARSARPPGRYCRFGSGGDWSAAGSAPRGCGSALRCRSSAGRGPRRRSSGPRSRRRLAVDRDQAAPETVRERCRDLQLEAGAGVAVGRSAALHRGDAAERRTQPAAQSEVALLCRGDPVAVEAEAAVGGGRGASGRGDRWPGGGGRGASTGGASTLGGHNRPAGGAAASPEGSGPNRRPGLGAVPREPGRKGEGKQPGGGHSEHKGKAVGEGGGGVGLLSLSLLSSRRGNLI